MGVELGGGEGVVIAMKRRCVKTVYAEYGSSQCSRSGVFQHKGKWYCKQHHPPTAEAKRKERDAKWDAHWDAQQEIGAAGDEVEAAIEHLRWAYCETTSGGGNVGHCPLCSAVRSYTKAVDKLAKAKQNYANINQKAKKG